MHNQMQTEVSGSVGALGLGQPLTGIKVVDLSRVYAGPMAGQMMGDFGADVIKVEQPGRGDDSRSLPPFIKKEDEEIRDMSASFLGLNRNKRSITVDLRNPEGYAIIAELIKGADVVIENFKTGGLKKYKLDYESVKKLNPGVIYCSITGFGQSGPYKDRPGYDIIFQAMSGLMSISGHPPSEPGGGPMRVGYSTVDMITGLTAALGIVTALMHKIRSGSETGQYIDLALLDTQIFNLSHMALKYHVNGVAPEGTGNTSYNGTPVRPFDCADYPIMLSVGNDIQWRRFCRAVGLEHMSEDPRFLTNSLRVKHGDEINKVLEPLFLTRTAKEWVDMLNDAGVPIGPLYDMKQVFEDEQVLHRKVLRQLHHPQLGDLPSLSNPLNFSETPVEYNRPPPLKGEHTDEILREVLGFDDDKIRELREKGVV